MKKITSIIISVIIILLFVLFIISPKELFSENENRYLTKFPKIRLDKIISGEFRNNFTNYVSDHFPFRNQFLGIKTNTLKHVGVYKQNDVYFGTDGYLLEEYKKPINSSKIIQIINEFYDKLENVEIDFILAPTSIYVNSDKLPKYNITYDEMNTINYYKNNVNVNFIDVANILKNKNNEYLYYKTDHHWTTYGAYLAYLEYCNAKNLEENNYDFEIVTDKFYGTLYSKVLDNSLEYDQILSIKNLDDYEVYYDDNKVITNSVYEEKYLSKKDKYSYFLDNNHSLITITNKKIKNDDCILIIKDSYANSFIPFLIQHYKKIHVIDPRYYNDSISEYILKNNIRNILFLYNVLTIDNDIGILGIN